MSLRERVERLERTPLPAAACPGPPTAIVDAGAPYDSASAPPCRMCGQPHALVITEEIVEAPDAAAPARVSPPGDRG